MPIDLDTIKQLAQLLGANPAILVIGYLVLRKIDAQHQAAMAALAKVQESLDRLGGQLVDAVRRVPGVAERARA